jgi:hypothetical protein
MRRIYALLLLLLPLCAIGQAQDSTAPQRPLSDGGPRLIDVEENTAASRWLDEVRAQRRALQEQRRAQHEARKRAIDPVGAAEREAREEEFLRRRQEMRELIEADRRLFMNQGPWISPSPPLPATSGPADPNAPQTRPGYVPPDWDNGWYFHGW